MNSINILYTPLDTPDVPVTDIPKLLEWITKNQAIQKEFRIGRDASKDANLKNLYPWDIIYPKINDVWQYNFDQEFPELAEFFYSAYGLDESDINTITLLPVKNDFNGVGFWHSDPDEYGLRMYIENQEPENFLLIKPTVEPYELRQVFGTDQNFKDIKLQDKILSVKLRAHNQTFYINNVRAVHAVNTTNTGSLRIAVIVICKKTPRLTKIVNDLVVKSAEKYPDYAIHWTAE